MADEDLKLLLKKGVKEGRLQGSWKGDDLISLLRVLPERIASGKKIRKRLYIIFLPLSILSLIFVLNNATHDFLFITIPVFIISIAVFLITLSISIKLKFSGVLSLMDGDINSYVKPLLEMILEDVRKGSVVSLELELRPIKSRAYLKKKGENYSKGKYKSCFDNFYNRNFFSLKANMHDGNRISLACADFMKESAMTKKSPKGRDKTVYKYRKTAKYQIGIRINPDRYKCGIKPEMKNGSGDEKIEFNETPKGAVLTMTFSETITGRSISEISYKEPERLIQRIARLYSCLAPASN